MAARPRYLLFAFALFATTCATGKQSGSTSKRAVEVERGPEGFLFRWKAEDSEGTEIAEESRTVLFTNIDDPSKPHAYLEQYIRTNIQKTKLKRKNRLKVVAWAWLERE